MATIISSAELERLVKRITELDRQSEHLRIWLYGWTAAVALGLILEYRKEFVRLAEFLWVYTFGNIPFEWWRIRAIVVAIGAGTLVTVGVIGELWIEFQQSGLETELAATNGKLTGDLGELAKEAANNADDALRDAGAAMTQIGTVGAKAQAAEDSSKRALETSNKAAGTALGSMDLARVARIEADAFQREIELAREEATKASEEADRERRAREYRDLTAEQRAKLGDELPSLDKSVPVRFESIIGDSEGKRYADRLSAPLSAVGIRVIPSDGLMGNNQLIGIWVTVSPKSPQKVKDAAQDLLRVFRAAGLPHVNRNTFESPALNRDIGVTDLLTPRSLDEVEILIGKKPMSDDE